MKQKKEPIVKDERTMLLDGKIAGELVLGMTCFIALSAFVKASILDLALVAYMPELILLIVLAILVFALLTYLLEKPLALINRKKQEKIEAELEDEE